MFNTSILLSAFLLLTLSSDAGQVWINGTSHDFGLISSRDRPEYRFLLLNQGRAPLRIDNVRTPCGCTAVDWPELPIPPGDTAAVLVEYHATTPGAFHKTIKVFFHGQKGPDQLTVRGTVTEP
jgi:hypothetical protein